MDILLGLAAGAALVFINQVYPGFIIGYPQDIVWGSAFWSAVILAPILEEALFRGILLPMAGLSMKGMVVVALVFSAFHAAAYGMALQTAFVGAFVVGLIAAMLTVQRGSVTAAIVMHAVFNWWLTSGRLSIFTG